MEAYKIRRFEDRDHEEVREVVINSFNEMSAPLFRYALWQPGIQLAILTVFCFLFLSSESFLLSSAGLALMVLAVNRAAYHLTTKNWTEVVLKDFLNIKKTYMETSGSCFWVADCNGKVVGTIGAKPSKEKKGALEMKRFAVRMGYRGQGVGKALFRALCDFAQANGNQSIVLCTSVIHYEGLKFYERSGFKKTREYYWPSLLGKALNLLMICYRYDLSLS
ncbi:CMLO acetyltransferase, partial [Polypterus senegalus]